MNIVKNNRTTWFLTVNQQRFWLQSDNTVKEVRNTYGARMLSAMTQAGVWSTSSQNFLGVGHTHEDVDGVLSLCKAAMDTATVIHTPQDVASRLKSKEIKAQSSFPCTWHRSSSGDYWEGGMWDSPVLCIWVIKKNVWVQSVNELPLKGPRLGIPGSRPRDFQQRIQDPKAARGWGGSNTSSTQFHLHPSFQSIFLVSGFLSIICGANFKHM